jgi:hypothetical protein
MQDTDFNSIGACSQQFGGWLVTRQSSAKRLGDIASRALASCPAGELVVVGIVSIFLLRGSG